MRLGLFALLLSWMISSHAFANPKEKVREVKVNGFTVYLIDVEKGNQFGYTFSVPYGSADDEPRFFGRAHYFEHMFARGSKRFPGHETLIKAITGFGYARNAATGFEYTMYYGKGHEKHALEAMNMHMASIDAVDLESSSMEREKATVVNEVVTSAPGQPTRGVYMLAFDLLPEPGHGLKGQLVGDRSTLDPMSADDLRELHQRIYHAGNLKIGIFGNFTNGMHTRDQIIEELTKILPQAKEQKSAYVPAEYSPVFASNKVLETVNPKTRLGFIFLPIAKDADTSAVNAFLNVFTSSSRNGLEDLLRSKLGWATSIGGEVLRVGSQKFALLEFEMTAEGYKNRIQLSRWLLEAVKSSQEKLFPEAVVKQRQQYLTTYFKREQNNIDGMIMKYAQWMAKGAEENKLHMNWDQAFDEYSPETLQKGAKAILTKNMAFSFMGPEASQEDQLNEFYKLKYRIKPWKNGASKIAAFNPEAVSAAEAQLTSVSGQGPNLKNQSFIAIPGWSFLTLQNEKWEDRTVQLNIEFANLTALQRLSLKAFLNIAQIQLRPETEHLFAQGMDIKMGSDNVGMAIAVRGKSGLEVEAMEWFLKKLKTIEVPQTLLEQFREKEALSLLEREDGFAGSVAIAAAQEMFSQSQSGHLDLRQQINALSVSSIQELRNTIMTQSHKTVSVGGPYEQQEVYRLMAMAAEFSPHTHSQSPMEAAPHHRVQSSLQYAEGWEDPSRTDLGVIRLLPGPMLGSLKDKMAMGIVGALLQQEVFLKNRPLGYVQGASRIGMPGQMEHFLFYGQVGSEDQKEKLIAIWDAEIQRWLKKEITAEEIENARGGLIAQYLNEPQSSEEGIDEALQAYDRNKDPFVKEQMLKTLKNLTVEEVYAAAAKYLHPDQPSLTILKGMGPAQTCEEILSGRAEVRKKLLVKK